MASCRGGHRGGGDLTVEEEEFGDPGWSVVLEMLGFFLSSDIR